jgi:hypothetical protein
MHLPLALDGESITNNNTAIAILSAVSIFGGYVLLAGLWFFVFRTKGDPKTEEHSQTEQTPPLTGAQSHRPEMNIQRRRRPRFPRR